MEYDFKTLEPEVLKFWSDNKVYEKARKAVRGKRPFYFLDGPPYTSGKVHIGTAWNKALKDMVLRYKRMRGFDVWDRAGYDMHGMPTEHAVEKKLGFRHKKEILDYGVERFVKECKEFSVSNMNIMSKDFKRLGVWMDFDNAYKTISPEYIEGEWWLVKKAHENKRLYEGEKTMTWCSRCATALAKHELEYKNVTDDSIFVKFRIKGKGNEYLVAWTTTPWTIPFNLGIMVHPDFDYIKAKVGGEVWIVAKALAGSVIKQVANKDFTVLEEFKGKKLKGLHYKHPFEAIMKKEYDELRRKADIHRVVLSSEYVNLEGGTGLVHMAPGCGPEDYEVGYANNIQPLNTLDEEGVFQGSNEFTGLKAKKDDKRFIEALEKLGNLIAVTRVEHEYAHCWRCKEPVIYRTTVQWFFRVEDLKERMRELNKKIFWIPEFAGSRSFDSWLSSLRDNGITRQRFWGTPLPIWRCEKCREYTVIGSIKELEEKAGRPPKDFHKPWIDGLTIKCKCSGTMKRIPDILDVWVDAGTASWNCLDYPRRKDLFEKMFPADFILEGTDQIRGWFNLLLVASMVAMQKPSFKAVYMHGFINDALGRKMSKSLGNYISPEEVIEKYGADTLRHYMIGATNPGVDLTYNFDDMKTKYRNLVVLWNIHNYMIDYAKANNVNPAKLKIKNPGLEEKYILSKLNSSIEKATGLFEKYELNQIPWTAEELFLELSRTYIKLTREKLSIGSEDERKLVLATVYEVLTGVLKMLAPICPFITEQMHQNLRKEFGMKEESIHLLEWPKADKKRIDDKLEKDMIAASQIVQATLGAREQLKLGVRWPLAKAVITGVNVKELTDVIATQTNIKKIEFRKEFSDKGYTEAEFPGGKVYLDKTMTAELEQEGFARELTRQIQEMRKKAGLKKQDRIQLTIATKYNLDKFKDSIKEKVGATKIEITKEKPTKKFKNEKTLSIREKEFWIGF